MYLSELKLQNFRNYEKIDIKFNPHINIIYGNNAQGKTNLLEGIYYLGLTKSHLYNLENALIKNKMEFFKISGMIKEEKNKKRLEIVFKNNIKRLKIDNIEIKKNNDYIVNSLNIIFFYPEDLEIIKGSPNIRRNYLNTELGQISKNYLKILNDYEKILKIRNELLKQNEIDKSYFDIITNYFIEKSYLIYKMRVKFVNELNENCGKIFNFITKISGFNIKYVINFDEQNYKKNLREKLENNYLKEKKLGTTLYGPHRDDLEFYLNDLNLKLYGSQGQKRVSVLAMKLSEIAIFKKYKNSNPILLLDDVFSEIDDIKKNNIIEYLLDNIQVFITTTEKRKINKNKFNSVSYYKIKNGEVTNIEEVVK